MMIRVQSVSKVYQVHTRKGGMRAALKSFFHREFKSFRALDDVSFSIQKGEIVGVIGANGAGKTTLLKCLIGLLHPTTTPQTRLEVLGFNPWKRERSFLNQVSIVLGQKNQLWWDLPAVDSFELHRHIYQIPKKIFHERLEELVQLLDVKDKLGIQVRRLSLGERMKMEIIAALLHHPTLVLLDEPTIGLDISAQRAMRQFIRDFNERHHTTFLITSHYMRDIEELCPRVLIIHEGKLLFDGALEKLKKVVPVDDRIDAQFSEVLSTVTRENLEREIEAHCQGRITWGDGSLSCFIPHARVGEALSRLATQLHLSDLQLNAATMEETISYIYKNPKLLGDLRGAPPRP